MAQFSHSDAERLAPPAIADPVTARVAGGVLIVAAMLTVVAMAHHPAGHQPDGAGPGMTLSGFIHATMIGLLAANLWGLTVFAARQSPGGWMLAGILAYPWGAPATGRCRRAPGTLCSGLNHATSMPHGPRGTGSLDGAGGHRRQ